jgi:hypothetical protein
MCVCRFIQRTPERGSKYSAELSSVPRVPYPALRPSPRARRELPCVFQSCPGTQCSARAGSVCHFPQRRPCLAFTVTLLISLLAANVISFISLVQRLALHFYEQCTSLQLHGDILAIFGNPQADSQDSTICFQFEDMCNYPAFCLLPTREQLPPYGRLCTVDSPRASCIRSERRGNKPLNSETLNQARHAQRKPVRNIVQTNVPVKV